MLTDAAGLPAAVAAPHRRRHASERVPLRGDSGRHRGAGRQRRRAASRGGPLDVFVNHETSTVAFAYGPTSSPPPANHGQLAERLRQLAGGAPDDQRRPESAQRLVRDREQRGLPALLLELPRAGEGGLRPSDPVHERGGDRLGRSRRSMADSIPPARPERSSSDSSSRYDIKDGHAQADLRDGSAQPRERRRAPAVRTPGRALGRRHVLGACDPSSTSTPRRARAQLDSTRRTYSPAIARRPYSATEPATTTTFTGERLERQPTRSPENDYGDLHARRDGLADRSLPLPESGIATTGDDPRVDGPWRAGSNSTTCSSSSASRTSLTTERPERRVLRRYGRASGVAARDGSRDQQAVARTFRNHGSDPNGRICKMVLDEKDPTKVLELSVLLNADSGGYFSTGSKPTPAAGDLPCTTRTTSRRRKGSLLIQEDPGSSTATSRVRRLRGSGCSTSTRPVGVSGNPQVVAKVDQSADGGPTDEPALLRPQPHPPADPARGRRAASSTPRRPSARAAFLIDVQAHTLWVETAPGPDNLAPVGPGLHVQARRRAAPRCSRSRARSRR